MIARKATWQLQEAKNKLSEVIRRARDEGPQTITVRGADAVVVVRTATESSRRQPRENLWEFFQRSPAAGIDFEVLPLGDIPPREVSFWFDDEEDED